MNEADLVGKAIKARENAYAPYSKFKVGAALLAASGKVYTGCNVENAAYPATCCAERTAIFSAITAGERKFNALAVAADTDDPVPPCGSCRQVMAEFFAPAVPVTMANLGGKMKTVKVSDLLPYAFGKDELDSSKGV